MLAIRMQRTGRKGHAMFRVVVQDSRRTPTSGKIVASIGNYDPHAKTVSLDKDKAAFYLEHGAQPSDRAARLLKGEGVKLPSWVTLSSDHKRATRNPDKRRSTRPAEAEKPEEPAVAEPVEAPAAEAPAAAEAVEAPAEAAGSETEAAEAPAAEPEAPESADKADAPAAEDKPEKSDEETKS